jgi:hypothetical protein
MTRIINISKDFSRSPAGRDAADGPFSGQRFREEVLVPALQSGDQLVVDLTGALTFGSSFLEEAFGGLVRVHRFKPAELRDRIRIRTDLRTYSDRIWRYVDAAAAH